MLLSQPPLKGNMMNRVRVALFNDRATAEPIQQRLLQAGIPAEIHDELVQARLWFISKLSAGGRIEVPAKLSEMAQQLLLAWDDDGALCAAIRCPECKSLRVDYPQVERESFSTNLAIGVIAGLGLVEKNYYCESCNHMWPKPRATPPCAHAHLEPNYFTVGLSQKMFRMSGGLPQPNFQNGNV